MSNPFMDTTTTNPFMDLAPAPAQHPAVLPACGDPACRKSHRPDNSHYSLDRATRMKEMQEDGKMGPQFGALGGARPKSRRRAAEVVAESAAENAEKIKQVFLDGIDEGNAIGVRLQAAKELLKVEGDDIEREMKQKQAEFDAMNKEELVGSIQEMLSRLTRAGAIAGEVEQMVNGEIVDADVIED